MKLEYIKEFVMLAQLGGFQETADALFISQSTLSKHVKAIEGELGVQLLDRSSRKASLNQHGQTFLLYAQQISALQEQYTQDIRNQYSNVKSTVVLGTIPVMAQYHITDIIAMFKQNEEHLAVAIVEADTLVLLDMLRNKECELAFLRKGDIVCAEFAYMDFAPDTLVAITSQKHPLASHSSVKLQELQYDALLMLEEQTLLNDLCMKACHQAGFTPNVAFSGHRTDNIIDLAAKGLGVGLLMKKQVTFHNRNDIAMLEIIPVIHSDICLCYLKDVRLSDAAMHFIHCVERLKMNDRVGI
ncbi:MAG: LysR family transcriptional regulator [Clostridiales bacterium]|nr:LysR family transcriptional regulator [Clostridiales bacterium]